MSTAKICPQCGVTPKKPGQYYCFECMRAYNAANRERHAHKPCAVCGLRDRAPGRSRCETCGSKARKSGQPGVCDICAASSSQLLLDVDPVTTTTAGTLCESCYRAISQVRQPGWLAAAQQYLSTAAKPIEYSTIHRGRRNHPIAEALRQSPCDICGDQASNQVIDHDHCSGLIRGGICRACNSRLHWIEHHPERLALLCTYITSTQRIDHLYADQMEGTP